MSEIIQEIQPTLHLKEKQKQAKYEDWKIFIKKCWMKMTAYVQNYKLPLELFYKFFTTYCSILITSSLPSILLWEFALLIRKQCLQIFIKHIE